MNRTWRPIGLAAAGLGLVCISAWPTAPIAADRIVTNIDAGDIALAVPAPVSIESPPPHFIEPEPVDDDTALAAAHGDVGELPLPALVDAMVAMQGPQLSGDLRCLASAVYYEARGESIEGQLAVAQVVLNRAASSRWPRELCKVIYQPGQFSFTFDGQPDVPRRADVHWRRAEAIAVIAATDTWRDVTDKALFFHADYVSPGWRQTKEQTRQIGRHIFYR